ncbi:MAG: 2-amino-4-hydroxy-6-hydroxymethyldihydropteridine diphosphokinase [Candidatus Krumholzibacteria bacterium]|nr:2-amino-4-hydroxy-6-hydroxymethyldihydropteridine diphosphokinase [Candidatus Krumholzibacteria bacterium]
MPDRTASLVVLSLGSNLGARERAVLAAARAVAAIRGIAAPRLSSLYETDPVGRGYSRAFVNAAMIVEARRDPRSLLRACLAIEEAAGRRPGGGDRPLDIDIVLFGDLRLDGPSLVLPHPRMRERLFVLGPLAELAPGLSLPPDGLAAAEAADRLRDGPEVRRISSRAVIRAGDLRTVRD